MFRGGVWGWDQISLGGGSPHGGLRRKRPGTMCMPFAYLQNMPTKRSITRWCLWLWNSRTTSHSFLVCSIISHNKREPTQDMTPMPGLEHGWHGHSFYGFWGTVVYCNHLRTEQLRGMAGCVLFHQRLIYNLPAIRATICLCCGLVCPQGAGGCGVKMQCCVSSCFTLWFQSTWLSQSVLITLSRLFLRQSNGS